MQRTSDVSQRAIRLLFVTVAAFVVLSFVGSVLGFGLAEAGGTAVEPAAIPGLAAGGRQILRLVLLVGNLLGFAGAALAGLWLVYRRRWAEAAGFVRPVRLRPTVYATALFVLSLPLVVYASWLNLQLPLPDWALRDEVATNALLGGVLRMESVTEFALALLTVAVTPAVGEELLLRGVLQRRVLQPLLTDHHSAIWIAAALFSAGHMEFAGFFPRLLLGAALGYAYHWTGSLWVPVVLHLLFNGLQVIQAYVTGEFSPDTTVDFVPPHWMGAFGLLLAAATLWYGEWQLSGTANRTRPNRP